MQVDVNVAGRLPGLKAACLVTNVLCLMPTVMQVDVKVAGRLPGLKRVLKAEVVALIRSFNTRHKA